MPMHARKIQGIGWRAGPNIKKVNTALRWKKDVFISKMLSFFMILIKKSDEMFCIIANLCNFAGDFFEKRNHLII